MAAAQGTRERNESEPVGTGDSLPVLGVSGLRAPVLRRRVHLDFPLSLFVAGAPTHVKVAVHSVLVAACGWHHLIVLWDSPPATKLQQLLHIHPVYQGGPLWLPESDAVL